MPGSVKIGLSRVLVPIPGGMWQRILHRDAGGSAGRLAFMTADHHRVRDACVVELARQGKALEPEALAPMLDLELERVLSILEELERRMTFVYRSRGREVTWAYPVTVDPTPHRITFSTGEEVNAAWGIDAMAVPFVQGQLRREPLTCHITTECAHCARPLHLEIDSHLHHRVMEGGADPRIFVPLVDFTTLEEPSIIDAFWRHSVFFWSEEHMKAHRRRVGGKRGVYLTLDQAAQVTHAAQSSLFGFPRQS